MTTWHEADLRDLMRRLDEAVENARSLPFVPSQLMIDRANVYDVIDAMRATLPEALKKVAWCRQRREADGDPPLGDSVLPSGDELFVVLDRLDELVRKSPPVPLSDRVRIDRDRLVAIVDRLRAVVVPLAQERATARTYYADL